MSPDFLHLEDDMQGLIDISTIRNNLGEIHSGEKVLDVLRDFYVNLYQCQDEKTEEEINIFLQGIDFPKLWNPVLKDRITVDKIIKAIMKLKPGKSPGSDGLTAAFYCRFAHKLGLLLAASLNKAMEIGTLSDMQKLAISILLYKKGDALETGNYRPISLTNLDYKILVYVLVIRLESYLPQIIHPNQTAYMKKRFIGANIRKVQDAIDMAAQTDSDCVVLFLDFKKAFDSVSHRFLWILMYQMGFP